MEDFTCQSDFKPKLGENFQTKKKTNKPKYAVPNTFLEDKGIEQFSETIQ